MYKKLKFFLICLVGILIILCIYFITKNTNEHFVTDPGGCNCTIKCKSAKDPTYKAHCGKYTASDTTADFCKSSLIELESICNGCLSCCDYGSTCDPTAAPTLAPTYPPCISGKNFRPSDVSNHEPCKPCTKCEHGEDVSCTLTSDAICTPPASCKSCESELSSAYPKYVAACATSYGVNTPTTMTTRPSCISQHDINFDECKTIGEKSWASTKWCTIKPIKGKWGPWDPPTCGTTPPGSCAKTSRTRSCNSPNPWPPYDTDLQCRPTASPASRDSRSSPGSYQVSRCPRTRTCPPCTSEKCPAAKWMDYGYCGILAADNKPNTKNPTPYPKNIHLPGGGWGTINECAQTCYENPKCNYISFAYDNLNAPLVSGTPPPGSTTPPKMKIGKCNLYSSCSKKWPTIPTQTLYDNDLSSLAWASYLIGPSVEQPVRPANPPQSWASTEPNLQLINSILYTFLPKINNDCCNKQFKDLKIGKIFIHDQIDFEIPLGPRGEIGGQWYDIPPIGFAPPVFSTPFPSEPCTVGAYSVKSGKDYCGGDPKYGGLPTTSPGMCLVPEQKSLEACCKTRPDTDPCHNWPCQPTKRDSDDDNCVNPVGNIGDFQVILWQKPEYYPKIMVTKIKLEKSTTIVVNIKSASLENKIGPVTLQGLFNSLVAIFLSGLEGNTWKVMCELDISITFWAEIILTITPEININNPQCPIVTTVSINITKLEANVADPDFIFSGSGIFKLGNYIKPVLANAIKLQIEHNPEIKNKITAAVENSTFLLHIQKQIETILCSLIPHSS